MTRFLAFALLILLLFAPGAAQAACTSPAANAGAKEWFSAGNVYKYCDGTNWVSFHTSGTLGACTPAANMDYDVAESAYKFCDGANWQKAWCNIGLGSGGGSMCSIPDNQTVEITGGIDHPGGSYTTDILRHGTSLYVLSTASANLARYDITNPATPIARGNVNIGCAGNAFGLAAAKNGDYIFVTCQLDSSINVVDAKTSPTVLTKIVTVTDTTGMLNASGAYVKDDVLFVTAWNSNSVSAWDISDPATLAIGDRISYLDFDTAGGSKPDEGSVGYGEIQGDYLYLALHWYGLAIVDISNPAAMTIVGHNDVEDMTAPYTHDAGKYESVSVEGNYAYVAGHDDWGAGAAYDHLTVFDVSNPAAPVQVAQINGVGDFIDLQVTGNYLFGGGYGTPDGLTIIDVSNPLIPVVVDNLSVGALGDAGGVDQWGEYVGFADWDNGKFWIFDLGCDPQIGCSLQPEDIALLDNVTAASMDGSPRVAVLGNYAYVPGDLIDTLNVINISDPNNLSAPVETHTSANLNGIQGIAIQGNYAYTASYSSDCVTAIDISNPLALVERDSVCNGTTLNGTQHLTVAGNFAYVAADDGDRVTIVDITDPNNLVIRGSYTSANLNAVSAAVVQGNYVYAVSAFADTFQSLNVSNPDSITLADTITNPVTLAGAYQLAVDGDYAYVAAWGSDSLVSFDISDPNNLVELDSISFPGGSEPRHVSVRGHFAVVAVSQSDQVSILDISDPADMKLIKTITSSAKLDYPYGTDILGRYAYIAAGDGLAAIDLGCNPLNVGGSGACTSPGTCTGQGKVDYFQNEAALAYCDGSDWVPFGLLDLEPNVFSFTDQTAVALSTLTTSNILQITGVTAGATVSLSGTGSPQYRTCSDAACSTVVQTWTSSSGPIQNNQYLQLRLTSSASQVTTNTATVTVGVSSDIWNITTTGTCTPGSQNFTTPGATSLTVTTAMAPCTFSITIKGGGGGAAEFDPSGFSAPGGAGGGTTFTYLPGMTGTMDIFVGGGGQGNTDSATQAVGGTGGGGNSRDLGGAGGGASALKFGTTLLAVAGGGGGAGSEWCNGQTGLNKDAKGGAGGGLNNAGAIGGNTTTCYAGVGGGGNIGGAGGDRGSGAPGGNGASTGGNGASTAQTGGTGNPTFSISGGGGGADDGADYAGGGGGGYGGGGGGDGPDGGGGGGGGGYLNTVVVQPGATSVTGGAGGATANAAGGNGSVNISWN